MKGTRSIDLTFGVDATLARVWRSQDSGTGEFDAASVRAMDACASAALPGARAEAAPLPAEAEIVAPTADEYLVASIAGQAYVCAIDDIHFVYDFYSVDLRCEGDSTRDLRGWPRRSPMTRNQYGNKVLCGMEGQESRHLCRLGTLQESSRRISRRPFQIIHQSGRSGSRVQGHEHQLGGSLGREGRPE